jgi:2-polyprenyl-3-methyl-5-hydroxy-6-metoxy-1,4-benzoquinol methylase
MPAKAGIHGAAVTVLGAAHPFCPMIDPRLRGGDGRGAGAAFIRLRQPRSTGLYPDHSITRGRMMERSFIWEKLAESYSKKPIADEAAYQKKLQVTREYLRPDMEIMEFGCGTGSTAIVHAPYVKHIQAIDISSKMIEIAQGKARAKNIENITFQRSTIDMFSAADGSFDAVMAFSILHLLDNRDEVIAKVHNMLKPGGIFVTSTICIGDTKKFIKFFAPIGRLVGLILKVFTVKELEDGLTGAGFEIDYQWQPPGEGRSVFIVAKKAG